MTKKQLIILGALAIFVVAEIILFLTGRGVPSVKNEKVAKTAEELLKNTETEEIIEVTPEVPEQAVETKPKVEAEINVGAGAGTKFGVYSVTASASGYDPSELVVRVGDTVQLEFTAKGGKYDLFIPAFGTYVLAENGATSQISFKAPQVGTYFFKCRDFCPLTGEIIGQLIVKPRE